MTEKRKRHSRNARRQEKTAQPQERVVLPSDLDPETLKKLREAYPEPSDSDIDAIIAEMFGDPPPSSR